MNKSLVLLVLVGFFFSLNGQASVYFISKFPLDVQEAINQEVDQSIDTTSNQVTIVSEAARHFPKGSIYDLEFDVVGKKIHKSCNITVEVRNISVNPPVSHPPQITNFRCSGPDRGGV